MSLELLGATFDIHGGGLDLQFPHHENEIAQSCCANPDDGFAKVWMHNEMIQVEGKKMSKSLGNFFTVKDLLDKGISGEVIRFVILSTHYRKPTDWTENKRREAENTLKKWRALTSGTEITGDVDQAVVEALSDDLNTPLAITRLHEMANDIARDSSKNCYFQKQVFRASLAQLGFDLETKELKLSEVHSAQLDVLTEKLKLAREDKNWAEADRLRDELLEAGVKLMVKGADVKTEILPAFDAEKLEAIK